MATRIALQAKNPIGRVKIGDQTVMVYATNDLIQALRIIVDSVNNVEAGIAAVEVSFSPAGSIAGVTVQAALEELDTEKATTGSVTAAQAFAIQRANHTGTQTAATISDFNASADARADLRVAAAIGVSVQAYDADLTTWAGKTAPAGTVVGTTDAQALSAKTITGGSIDNTPIGATTANTGKFTSVESTSYVKTASTTFAGLPAAATAGQGARHFITDCNSTTFLAVAAAGGANKVPVVSDGTNWLIG